MYPRVTYCARVPYGRLHYCTKGRTIQEYEYETTVLIVTLGKLETYKETIKEKSTILPYSIHKRIHVRPLRNLIQGYCRKFNPGTTVLVRVRVPPSQCILLWILYGNMVDFSFIVSFSLYVSDLFNVTTSTVPPSQGPKPQGTVRYESGTSRGFPIYTRCNRVTKYGGTY